MMTKMIKIISTGLMILIITGCTNVKLSAIKTFNLEVSKQCCKIDKNKQPLTIKILEPVTNKYLNTTSIYYSKDKYLLQTYKLSRWSDYPVKMILEAMSSKLDDLDIYNNVITSHIYAKSDYILQSELISFKQTVFESKSHVDLKIKVYLINSDKTQKIISKIFQYQVPCDSVNAYAGVESFNKSIELFINDLSSWLYKNTKV